MTSTNSVLARRSAAIFYSDAPEPSPKIWTARFSSDNKRIATGGGDSQINVDESFFSTDASFSLKASQIWEIDRRRLRASFTSESLVNCIDFAPNNRFLVSASDDLVCMWRTRDGARTTLFQHKSSDFTTAAFSPDGRYVAAGNEDGALWICDTRTYRLVTFPGNHGMDLRSVKFMPDGKGVAIGGKAVQCWGLSSFREIDSGRHIISPPLNLIFEFKGQPHDNVRSSLPYKLNPNINAIIFH